MAVMTSEPDGFALVEAVVALAIVGAILGVTFQTMSMARSTIAGAQARRVAMLQARSLTAQLGATLPLVAGTTEGQSGAFRWRIDTSSFETQETRVPLQHAVVTVTDTDTRVRVRLETLRVAR